MEHITGIRYFLCKAGHGSLVALNTVLPLPNDAIRTAGKAKPARSAAAAASAAPKKSKGSRTKTSSSAPAPLDRPGANRPARAKPGVFVIGKGAVKAGDAKKTAAAKNNDDAETVCLSDPAPRTWATESATKPAKEEDTYIDVKAGEDDVYEDVGDVGGFVATRAQTGQPPTESVTIARNNEALYETPAATSKHKPPSGAPPQPKPRPAADLNDTNGADLKATRDVGSNASKAKRDAKRKARAVKARDAVRASVEQRAASTSSDIPAAAKLAPQKLNTEGGKEIFQAPSKATSTATDLNSDRDVSAPVAPAPPRRLSLYNDESLPIDADADSVALHPTYENIVLGVAEAPATAEDPNPFPTGDGYDSNPFPAQNAGEERQPEYENLVTEDRDQNLLALFADDTYGGNDDGGSDDDYEIVESKAAAPKVENLYGPSIIKLETDFQERGSRGQQPDAASSPDAAAATMIRKNSDYDGGSRRASADAIPLAEDPNPFPTGDACDSNPFPAQNAGEERQPEYENLVTDDRDPNLLALFAGGDDDNTECIDDTYETVEATSSPLPTIDPAAKKENVNGQSIKGQGGKGPFRAAYTNVEQATYDSMHSTSTAPLASAAVSTLDAADRNPSCALGSEDDADTYETVEVSRRAQEAPRGAAPRVAARPQYTNTAAGSSDDDSDEQETYEDVEMPPRAPRAAARTGPLLPSRNTPRSNSVDGPGGEACARSGPGPDGGQSYAMSGPMIPAYSPTARDGDGGADGGVVEDMYEPIDEVLKKLKMMRTLPRHPIQAPAAPPAVVPFGTRPQDKTVDEARDRDQGDDRDRDRSQTYSARRASPADSAGTSRMGRLRSFTSGKIAAARRQSLSLGNRRNSKSVEPTFEVPVVWAQAQGPHSPGDGVALRKGDWFQVFSTTGDDANLVPVELIHRNNTFKGEVPETLIQRVDLVVSKSGTLQVLGPKRLQKVLKERLVSLDQVQILFSKKDPAGTLRPKGTILLCSISQVLCRKQTSQGVGIEVFYRQRVAHGEPEKGAEKKELINCKTATDRAEWLLALLDAMELFNGPDYCTYSSSDGMQCQSASVKNSKLCDRHTCTAPG